MVPKAEQDAVVELGPRPAAEVFAGALCLIGQAIDERKYVDPFIDVDSYRGTLRSNDRHGEHRIVCHTSNETDGMTGFVLKSNDFGDTSLEVRASGHGLNQPDVVTRLLPADDGSLRRVVTREERGQQPELVSDEPTDRDMILAELRRMLDGASLLTEPRINRIQEFDRGHSDGGLMGVHTEAFIHVIGDLLKAAGTVMQIDPGAKQHGSVSLLTAFNSGGRLYGYVGRDGRHHAKVGLADLVARADVEWDVEYGFADVVKEGGEFGFLHTATRRFNDNRQGFMQVITRDDLGQRGADLVWVRQQRAHRGDPEPVGVFVAREPDPMETELLGATAPLRPSDDWWPKLQRRFPRLLGYQELPWPPPAEAYVAPTQPSRT